MDNTMRGDAGASLSTAHDTSKLKLLLVWLAVGLPLLWGVVKTLQDGVELMP